MASNFYDMFFGIETNVVDAYINFRIKSLLYSLRPKYQNISQHLCTHWQNATFEAKTHV